MKFLVNVDLFKHSLRFLIPLPCMTSPTSPTKQKNCFSDLPDVHGRYVYTNTVTQIRIALLKLISQMPCFLFFVSHCKAVSKHMNQLSLE